VYPAFIPTVRANLRLTRFASVDVKGDAFCNGLHFADINTALEGMGEEAIDWLPSVGWDKGAKPTDMASASAKMGQFMSETMGMSHPPNSTAVDPQLPANVMVNFQQTQLCLFVQIPRLAFLALPNLPSSV